ncbi:MAG: SCO family protein [Methylococcales bacterium]
MNRQFRIGFLLLMLALCQRAAGKSFDDPEFLKLPNLVLVDQHGLRVNLERDLLHDRVVAIQFIYTRCTLVCPLLGYQFASLRRALGERAGLQVELISISVDPVHDTPKRLAAWAERYGSGRGWTQITGESTAINALLKAFEAFSPDIQDHTSLILIGNPDTGHWQRLNGTTPLEPLLDAIARAKKP